MSINRKLFLVTIDNSIRYNVVAESMQEALSIMNKWRPSNIITSIQQMSDCVLTKEDVTKIC